MTLSGSGITPRTCLDSGPESLCPYPYSDYDTVSLSFTSPSLSLSSLLTISTTGAVSSSTSLPLDTNINPNSSVSRLRASELFGPVPDDIHFPKEQAPPGARYCEEIHAFVPAHLPYRIRGIKKAHPKVTKDFHGWLKRMGHKAGLRVSPTRFGRRLLYEPLVMAMGLSHGQLKLIELGEARQRPEIVYRSVAHLGLDLWNVHGEVDMY